MEYLLWKKSDKEKNSSSKKISHLDVRMQDPVWQAAHEQADAVSGEMAKACVQSPLEFRKTALAALALAARPADWGANAQAAADFCCKMMS